MDTDPASPRPADDLLVTYAVEDGLALVTLNRPAAANAQSFDLLYALDDCFRRAVDDPDVVAIALRGAGKHFSAGHDTASGDLRTWTRDVAPRTTWYDHGALTGVERQYVAEQEVYLGLCRRWRALPKPTIALVQGACISAGLMLAWVCDLIVASDDAYFMDNTVSLGVPGVEYFAHAFELPPRVAREFLLLGERMTAQRAYALGMVNRIVARDELLGEARRIADMIKARSRFAVSLAKQAMNVVDDLQGKRSATDAVFAMHHLAHAHNQATTGRSILMPAQK
ncbi:enoyl-CoA hydratase [Sphingomonas zeae]|jgi:enoyl-CoA hydratase